MSVALKVYGHIYPASKELESDLEQALCTAMQDPISLDVPLLCRENDMLRISFEGNYFPEDDVVSALKKHIEPSQKGKLDVLDIENWKMTRYFFQNGTITNRSASLNSVMDYSGF